MYLVSYTYAFSKCLQNKITNTYLFSRLFTTSTNNITTNECMHHTVIKSCIITETSDDLVHSYTSTSKSAKVNTIMSAKSIENCEASYLLMA